MQNPADLYNIRFFIDTWIQVQSWALIEITDN